jgi:ribose transport system ATP-binding protein
MYGAWSAESGDLVAAGVHHSLKAMRPDRAIAAGMVLIPADRQRDGAVGTLPVTDNMTLPDLARYRIGWRLRKERMRRRTAELMGEFDVRPAEPGYDYGALSGGNQQKALLAKWLQMEPRLILLHEPTQGVDVGARQQIFETIRAAAATGSSVVCASSDYEQLALICDRVLVFGRGSVGRELVGGEITKDRIAEQCYAAATDAREAA